MARRRSRSFTTADFPPTLRHLVRVATIECPAGHADAFSALASLALHKVPVRGIFDPGTRDEPELFAAIESVAVAHLHMSQARAAWRQALKAAQLPLDRRDDIETAALQVAGVSDTAYFYAGLAFGLVFVDLHRTP
jgi:hypothetical protein